MAGPIFKAHNPGCNCCPQEDCAYAAWPVQPIWFSRSYSYRGHKLTDSPFFNLGPGHDSENSNCGYATFGPNLPLWRPGWTNGARAWTLLQEWVVEGAQGQTHGGNYVNGQVTRFDSLNNFIVDYDGSEDDEPECYGLHPHLWGCGYPTWTQSMACGDVHYGIVGWSIGYCSKPVIMRAQTTIYLVLRNVENTESNFNQFCEKPVGPPMLLNWNEILPPGFRPTWRPPIGFYDPTWLWPFRECYGEYEGP